MYEMKNTNIQDNTPNELSVVSNQEDIHLQTAPSTAENLGVKTTINKEDIQRGSRACILNDQKSDCLVHKEGVRGIKVTSKKWEYNVRKKCYGYVSRKCMKYVCMTRIMGPAEPRISTELAALDNTCIGTPIEGNNREHSGRIESESIEISTQQGGLSEDGDVYCDGD